jgi:hypothetical protein
MPVTDPECVSKAKFSGMRIRGNLTQNRLQGFPKLDRIAKPLRAVEIHTIRV